MKPPNHIQQKKYTITVKDTIRRFLVNSIVISIARKLLRRFPSLQEAAGFSLYLLKKRLYLRTCATPTAKSDNFKRMLPHGEFQFLIDVSGVKLRDVHTGIQRVTRNLLQELLQHSPAGFAVKPVYTDAVGLLRYVRDCDNILSEDPDHGLSQEYDVHVQPGDVYFCPDSYFPFPSAMLSVLKSQGLRIIITVYDLIPFKYGYMYPKALTVGFSDWFNGVMDIADGLVCDSKAVANEVLEWLLDHPGARDRPLPIGFFHLGANIEYNKSTQCSAVEGAEALMACKLRQTLLMVGTIEPRKGYSQALAAVDVLWKQGIDLNLIIVGKEGWRTQALARQLRRHSEVNHRLFWLEGASDVCLEKLYVHASGLLATSIAEGFGLPLIEAARHGLPIIARDIPVFREVASDHAFYFIGETAESLSMAIQKWLILHNHKKEPQSTKISFLTWEDSTKELLKVIIESKWSFTYDPTSDV